MPGDRYSAPPFDVELAAVLALLADQVPPTLPRMAPPVLRASPYPPPPIEQTLAGRSTLHEERVLAGPATEPDIVLSITTRTL